MYEVRQDEREGIETLKIGALGMDIVEGPAEMARTGKYRPRLV